MQNFASLENPTLKDIFRKKRVLPRKDNTLFFACLQVLSFLSEVGLLFLDLLQSFGILGTRLALAC